jgi:hypothetical protein
VVNLLQEFFNCMKRGDRWYLAAEPSVECYDFSTNNKHRQYFALCLIALLVYVIGIPALFATLLYRRRKVRIAVCHAVPSFCPIRLPSLLSAESHLVEYLAN